MTSSPMGQGLAHELLSGQGIRQGKRESQNSHLAKTLIYGIDVYSVKGKGIFFFNGTRFSTVVSSLFFHSLE